MSNKQLSRAQLSKYLASKAMMLASNVNLNWLFYWHFNIDNRVESSWFESSRAQENWLHHRARAWKIILNRAQVEFQVLI